ncbi:MAG: M23 family metallopeptidase, partial [Nitrososphaera sp.]|nr:M23 family metallopeptidase [Nitrososphaera sp.]
RILHSPLAELICTQRFGMRPEVYKDFGCPKGHNGMDFRTRMSGDPSNWKQPVFVVLKGTVTEAAFDAAYKGNFVRVKHDNGYESVYLHLDSLKVKVGARVRAGQKIGISGNTGGASEAPHLHFGYRPSTYNPGDGYMGYVDPVNLFIDDVRFA